MESIFFLKRSGDIIVRIRFSGQRLSNIIGKTTSTIVKCTWKHELKLSKLAELGPVNSFDLVHKGVNKIFTIKLSMLTLYAI
jgi:hypothetical protein